MSLIISLMVFEGLAALVRLYVDISVWRRGPQDLPTVGILLPLTISAYVALSALCSLLLPPLQPYWMLQIAADVAFTVLWYWLLLAIVQHRERLSQTLTALFAAQTVFAIPSAASAWLVRRYAGGGIAQALAEAAALAVLIWMVAAIGHILRWSIERSLALCVILAFVQLLAEDLLFLAVFGGAL